MIAEGHGPEPCGYEIDPPKTLLFLDRSLLSRVQSPRPIRVGLTPEFIAASAVALIRFESDGV